MTATLGVLGTGHLASYTVAGLRNNDDRMTIVLSPRNLAIAKSLAEEYSCEIAADNQEVADRSDHILLAVRPHQLDSLLRGLKFQANTLIISAMAGVSIAQLKSYSNLKQSTIVRTLLNVSAEVNVGPVPLYPDNRQASRLLANLGTLITFDDESSFDVAVVHGCMHGWLYFWLDEMVSWTIDQGLNPEQAETMIKQNVLGAIALSDRKTDSLEEIGSSIATSGTYTLDGLERLNCGKSISAWSQAMQHVLDRLKQSA